MPQILSPGIVATEINASAIVPTVSNSIGVFAGDYTRGPVGAEMLITNVSELVTFYGQPTDTNFDDFFQSYNFLQYGNKLLVSRASNVTGSFQGAQLGTVTLGTLGSAVLTSTAVVAVGAIVAVGTSTSFVKFVVQSVVAGVSFTVDRMLTAAEAAAVTGQPIYVLEQSRNAVFESVNGTPTAAVGYFGDSLSIGNLAEFNFLKPSLAFSGTLSSVKLKFYARNPGAWGNRVEVCLADSTAFGRGVEAFVGVLLDPLFEYAPAAPVTATDPNREFVIVIREGGVIVEQYLVSYDPTAKDHNNKSMYVEDVLNSLSTHVFVKHNTSNVTAPANYCIGADPVTAVPYQVPFVLVDGFDGAKQPSDLIDAYALFDNKEAVDVDIVISNRFDDGSSAASMSAARADCLNFIGALDSDCVGVKSAVAVNNVLAYRNTLTGAAYGMFSVLCGNVKYQYDRYNDKYRWVGIQGDCAGLRAATSTSRASWWASAGLERGQIKNVAKLAFNPSQPQRDMLYKNSVNPIVSFPGQGNVMWGQKTMLSKPSSFDRVNVRGLFNTLERSLSKMAKYQIMEFNDNFTRNRIVSMIRPFLSTVQSGRGIQDFLVVCDESNNTPDIISRNQLIVDIYIKPMYVAEFIQLRFTNAGTNSFASVIGG